MSEAINPGPGYRLLSEDEIVRDGDERQDRADREPRPWLRVVCGVGRTVASYRGEFREIGILAVRRRVESEPSDLDTLRNQVVALTAERDELRKKLADTTGRLDERSEKVRSMTDYAINLQKAIEAHCRGRQDNSCRCPYHADMLNADLAMTPERACEVVTQLKRDGRLEWRDDHCDWIVAGISENWQCRPALPKPITLNVTCPPDKREAVEAAIKAAGGSV